MHGMNRASRLWIGLAVAIWAIAVFVVIGRAHAAAHPPTKSLPEEPKTCALIADRAGSLDKSSLFSLLEVRLSKHKGLRLVDRMEIKRVLEELKLKLMFGAAGGPERRRVGKILKADLLVALRAGQVKKVRYVDVVVCETAGGLRLLVRSVILSDKPQDGAARIEGLVGEALRKYAEGVAEICAVPPFLSGDLTHQYDHLQTAYARLIEQMLLKNKGMLVVELAEARAVAREVLLSGQAEGPKRKLPLYILGEYRHSGNGKDRKVAVNLTIKRGQKVLGSVKKGELVPVAVPAFLRKSTQQLVVKATGRKIPAPDPATEARMLAERAYTFRRIGNWTEALALYEASLLLKPDQPRVHHQATRVLAPIVKSHYDPYDDLENFKRKALVGLRYYQRYLSHLEAYLRTTPEIEPNYGGYTGAGDLERYAKEHGVREILDAISEVKAPYRGMCLRVLKARAAEGKLTNWDVHRLKHSALCDVKVMSKSWQEEAAARLQLIRMVQHLSKSRQFTYDFATDWLALEKEPEERYRAFLNEIAKIPNKRVQAGAEDARREYERVLAVFRRPRKRRPRPLRPDEQGPADIILHKLPFGDKLRGWLACGEGVDVAWTLKEFFLMKKKGRLKKIYSSKERFFNFTDAVYDGKYIWAPVLRGNTVKREEPLVLVIDPQTEKIWRFTASDGLPPAPIRLVAAALGPGKICMAGAFGRSWCAILRFDGHGKKSMEVFHEARRQRDISQKPHEAMDPKMAFVPRFMVTLTDQKNRSNKRVLVGRGVRGVTGNYPLLINTKTKTVTVLADRLSFSAISGRDVNVHEGALYLTIAGRVEKNRQIGAIVSIWRLGFPDFKKTAVIKKVILIPEISQPQAVFYGGGIYLVGNSWWTAGSPGGKFVRLRMKVIRPETSRKAGRSMPGGYRLRRFCESRHYGLLVMTVHDGVYKVEFRSEARSRADKQDNNERQYIEAGRQDARQSKKPDSGKKKPLSPTGEKKRETR